MVPCEDLSFMQMLNRNVLSCLHQSWRVCTCGSARWLSRYLTRTSCAELEQNSQMLEAFLCVEQHLWEGGSRTGPPSLTGPASHQRFSWTWKLLTSPPPRYRLVQPPLCTHNMCARRPPHTAQTPRQQRTETIPAKSCWGVMAVEADARNGQKCSSFHLVFHGETIFPPQRCSSDELQAHKGPFLCFSGMIRLGKNTAFPHHSCFNYPQCSSALLQSKFPNTDGKSKSILKLSVFQVKKDFQRRCVKFLKLLCLFYIKYFSVCPKFQCSLWDFIYSVWEGFYAFLCGSSFKSWTFTY